MCSNHVVRLLYDIAFLCIAEYIDGLDEGVSDENCFRLGAHLTDDNRHAVHVDVPECLLQQYKNVFAGKDDWDD